MNNLKKLIIDLCSKFGVGVELYRIPIIPIEPGIKINVGSGDWEKPGWINLDYPSEHYSKVQKKHKIIPYDIRNDALPFNSRTISAIYTSHVIEHIEDIHVQHLFDECYRALKLGGVLRIVCPDASFLYDVTKVNPKYWWWRHTFFTGINDNPDPVDYFMSEVGTENVINVGHVQAHNDYKEKFLNMPKDEFIRYIVDGLKYDVKYVSSHINYWTYEKIKTYLIKAGFETVIQSKYLGSCYPEMQDQRYFDLTERRMSLYVEAVKTR